MILIGCSASTVPLASIKIAFVQGPISEHKFAVSLLDYISFPSSCELISILLRLCSWWLVTAQGRAGREAEKKDGHTREPMPCRLSASHVPSYLSPLENLQAPCPSLLPPDQYPT